MGYSPPNVSIGRLADFDGRIHPPLLLVYPTALHPQIPRRSNGLAIFVAIYLLTPLYESSRCRSSPIQVTTFVTQIHPAYSGANDRVGSRTGPSRAAVTSSLLGNTGYANAIRPVQLTSSWCSTLVTWAVQGEHPTGGDPRRLLHSLRAPSSFTLFASGFQTQVANSSKHRPSLPPSGTSRCASIFVTKVNVMRAHRAGGVQGWLTTSWSAVFQTA